MNLSFPLADFFSRIIPPFLLSRFLPAKREEGEAPPQDQAQRSPLLAASLGLLRPLPLRRPRELTRPRSERFRPYVAKVPWHGGVRAFLSQLFPRYGHYCGPNWSSGKDGGSMLWDRRPIDWLDLCCYCHDIGYDTHDQAELLRADLAFLQCLERPRMPTKGDARVADLYKSMCIAGLRNILIPYRMQLVRLQGKEMAAEKAGELKGRDSGVGHGRPAGL